MATFQDLYNRALTDASFRRAVATDPSSALRSVGVEPTPDLLQHIADAIAAVRKAHVHMVGAEADDDSAIS